VRRASGGSAASAVAISGDMLGAAPLIFGLPLHPTSSLFCLLLGTVKPFSSPSEPGNARQQWASVIGQDGDLILSRISQPSKLVFALEG
jgi:hypothetical protein